jgi:hypothetical protein
MAVGLLDGSQAGHDPDVGFALRITPRSSPAPWRPVPEQLALAVGGIASSPPQCPRTA